MLLLPERLLDARRVAAAGPLKALADSLAAELEPLLARKLYVPTEKALLSRIGGRCERDNTVLNFDPFSPRKHKCPACGRQWRGDFHHRAWIYPYQLWLAERAVHGALLYVLRGEDRHRQLASNILERYVSAYPTYPNRDNVLGPTRVFFSTYLESIWLLQLCVAADVLEAATDRSVSDAVREAIVRPSAALIAQYDEGFSNRQVWNNAALMAASLLLGDRDGAERSVRAPSGVEAHLAECLLADGTWYEGDNYHLFAHRGLWYCITLAETAGISINAGLVRRFNEGFATPFATALPDFTFPSRKDSQYNVSLQQWRFAELAELGLARGDDRRLTGALATLYSASTPPGDTGRSRSTADVERNVPAARLARSDLGWRALLHARATLPPVTGSPPVSAHLEQQGITVFRRESGAVYVALDWGQSGGGHGHPDRLNVLFSHGDTRWLDDLGTGSYVDPSLHWYRSTLAHTAPLVNGCSQRRVNGMLLAHDERGGVGWVYAIANNIAHPGVHVSRAIVVTPDYFVDELRWVAPEPVRFELPLHFAGEPGGLQLEPDNLDGGGGLEDGFDFVRDVTSASVPAHTAVELASTRDGRSARAWVAADRDARWFSAFGPGQPATAMRRFHVVRCEGVEGAIRSVWAWSSRVSGVVFKGERIAVTLGEERHLHFQTPDFWQMEITVGGAHSGIELFGLRPPPVPPQPRPPATRPEPIPVKRNGPPAEFELREPHYRRSEDTWVEAGCPHATVAVTAFGAELVVTVIASASPFKYGPRSPENPYDNDPVEIHYPGVQLYVRTATNGGAWIVRPDAATHGAHVRPIAGWGSLELARSHGELDAFRYKLVMQVTLPPEALRGDYEVAIDVIVNDAPPHRERRRGQLVMSGARNEFVYLRSDGHSPERLVPILLTDSGAT
jgi:hypothetical protein